jgi:ABC-type uncharacterized transport system involved in gliding motility auxiliary subunit
MMKEQLRSALPQGGPRRVLVGFLLLAASALACTVQRPSPSPLTTGAPPGGAQKAPDPARYTLTAGSGRLVRSLKSTVLVDAYVVRGLPHLDQLASELTDLLTAYEQQGQGKLKFRLLEANTAALREQAKQEGLQEQPLSETTPSDKAQDAIARGYLGLVFRYGSEKAVIPWLPADTGGALEFWISNKLREIRDRADGIKRRIGVVTGKDELKLSDTNLVAKAGASGAPSIKSIFDEAFPHYRLEELDLKQGANAIDSELAGLIITQPQKDYTEPELRRVDDFLMLGDKSLVVFASAVNLKPNDPTLLATLSTRGLDTLLDGYGLHMNRDAVFDHDAQFRVPVSTPGSPPAWLRHPGLALVVNDADQPAAERRLDDGFAGFFRMEELMFPFPSSLELERGKQPADVRLQAVARSTPAAVVETGNSVDMKLRADWTPKSPQKQRILAAYAQGKLKSAFASRPRPGGQTPERAPRSSRVLLISSSEFITNPFAYAGNGVGGNSGDATLLQLAQPYTKHLTGTILAIKNTLDWMTGDEDLLAASAKLVGPKRKR